MSNLFFLNSFKDFLKNLFGIKKNKAETIYIKLPDELVQDCKTYLLGGGSDSLRKRVSHLKNQDPGMTDYEAIEFILDSEERRLRKK